MDFDAIYEPNPADDEPLRRYVPAEEGVRIGVLERIFIPHDSGPFDNAADALAYLQTHQAAFMGKRLRIGTKLYHVCADGLYHMTPRKGWQLLEGVNP